MAEGNFGAKMVGAVVKGAASGGGLIGAGARAVQTGGNAIRGITKNLSKWSAPSKPKKSRFKKIVK